MKIIQKWSYACANYLTTLANENHQKRAIYYYAFLIIIGELAKAVILFSVALLLGVFTPMLLIFFTFGSLRTLAGGYHMDTYDKCLLVTMVLFISAALIARHTYMCWNTTGLAILIAFTIISGLYVLVRYAPKDTPNKPITDPNHINKLKFMSIIYLFILATITSILTAFKINTYVLSICFGILLELFTITPIGHKFFEAIKCKLDFKKTKQKHGGLNI